MKTQNDAFLNVLSIVYDKILLCDGQGASYMLTGHVCKTIKCKVLALTKFHDFQILLKLPLQKFLS